MATKTITDASFDDDVLKADGPVLVDFWAEWCGPCKMIGPSLEELSDELGDRVTIVKLDIQEHQEVAAQMGVRQIPVLKLFNGGTQVAELLGARRKSELKAWLEGALG